MEKKVSTAFVSYSWDSPQHQDWVHFFVNSLRGKGIDASFDQFLTQETSVNLFQMMIKAIQENDYVIIVLTEKYAQRADSFQGGVGFETLLTLPMLQQNLDKLIFVMRHQGDYRKVFPFHLQGYHAIDFSKNEEFTTKLEELVHRIYKVPLREKAPLGPIPDLQPRVATQPGKPAISPFADLEFPNLQRITDMDKMEFIKKSFKELCQAFSQLFDTVREQVPGFQYTVDEVTAQKQMFWLYVNGNLVSGVKIWIGGLGSIRSNQTIALFFGSHINPNHDGSMNEMISCDEEKGKLRLKLTMNMYGENPDDPIGIVKHIWKWNLAHCLR